MSEPYDPDILAHQEPVEAVSEWQQRNDADGRESVADELERDRDENDRIYPCKTCGTMRTKAEGGNIFTECDECREKSSPRKP